MTTTDTPGRFTTLPDEQTLQALRAMGCDQMQGYHLSRPQPVGDLTPWLLAHAWHAAPAVA